MVPTTGISDTNSSCRNGSTEYDKTGRGGTKKFMMGDVTVIAEEKKTKMIRYEKYRQPYRTTVQRREW